MNVSNGEMEMEPFVLNLDDHATIELENALENYRNMELTKVVEEQSKLSRIIHNRLRESYTLGAGVLLEVKNKKEAQLLMNTIAYYNPPIEHLFKRRYCECLTNELRKNSPASIVKVPTPKDVDEEVEVDVPDGTDKRETEKSPCSMDVGVSVQKL